MIDERKQNQNKIYELQTHLTEMKVRNGLLQSRVMVTTLRMIPERLTLEWLTS